MTQMDFSPESDPSKYFNRPDLKDNFMMLARFVGGEVGSSKRNVLLNGYTYEDLIYTTDLERHNEAVRLYREGWDNPDDGGFHRIFRQLAVVDNNYLVKRFGENRVNSPGFQVIQAIRVYDPTLADFLAANRVRFSTAELHDVSYSDYDIDTNDDDGSSPYDVRIEVVYSGKRISSIHIYVDPDWNGFEILQFLMSEAMRHDTAFAEEYFKFLITTSSNSAHDAKMLAHVIKERKMKGIRDAIEDADLYVRFFTSFSPGANFAFAIDHFGDGEYLEGAIYMAAVIPWGEVFAGSKVAAQSVLRIGVKGASGPIIKDVVLDAGQVAIYRGLKSEADKLRLLEEIVAASSNGQGKALATKVHDVFARLAPNRGKGLIGLVKPGGMLDDTLKAHYLKIVRSPQMASAVERYNKIARFLGQKPSATIDEIAEALGNDVTFAKIGHLRSGVFESGHAGTTRFWLQGNPTTAYGQRAGRHELTHIGAALRGQGDTWRHEIAVQLATTPENLVAVTVGFVVVIGGEVYWITSQ